MIVYGRGLKVPRERFNAFLSPYDVDPLLGSLLQDSDEEEIATVFRNKGIDWKFRIFLPYTRDYEHSPWIYIFDSWVFVFTQKRVGGELDTPIPSSLEALRQLLSVEPPVDKPRSTVIHVTRCSHLNRPSWPGENARSTAENFMGRLKEKPLYLTIVECLKYADSFSWQV
ncbi:unnamed protein product [Clonostachys rosea f. rosea IK726]|uniref:Uncharacterized protein n=1 Tax=Clonostachys rosea f. rosea IK726 TaxID=1349383 RepID=A0ACA9TFB9_BIOOC|nr:unnamed protein product [Clonostachys rosea f. rosea IK726]